MKEFYFLFTNNPPPSSASTIESPELIISLMVKTIQQHKNLSVIIPAPQAVTASMYILKMLKADDKYYFMTDTPVPKDALQMVLKYKKTAFCGVIDNLPHGFLSTVVQYQQAKGILLFELPTTLFRIQRRRHFRLRPHDNDSVFASIFIRGNEVKTPVYDISESGVSIYSKYSKETFQSAENPNMIYNIQLKMPDGRIIEATIQIILVIKKTQSKLYEFKVCSRYIKISPDDVKYLSDYIYEKQKREYREKQTKELESELDNL